MPLIIFNSLLTSNTQVQTPTLEKHCKQLKCYEFCYFPNCSMASAIAARRS
jgi:hypothetical protein